MRRRSSTSSKASLARLLAAVSVGVLVIAAVERRAAAQACCAGSGAVTPGRLAVHEDALVAVTAKANFAFGSFDSRGHYATPAAGSSEQDYEQDAIGALRIPKLDRAQVALLVPLIENRRVAHGTGELGGGLGDVNFAARYDLLYAGQNRYIPGIGALIGITFPTGRTPEQATNALATDATGIGAFQGNLGITFEQLFGNWLVTAYGIVAKRASRTANGVTTTLGTQWTALFAVAYALPRDYAIAASASYTVEGDAEVQGADAPDSARRIPIVGVSGVVPVNDHLRFQGGVNLNPPLRPLGQNQPTTVGVSVTALYAWY